MPDLDEPGDEFIVGVVPECRVEGKHPGVDDVSDVVEEEDGVSAFEAAPDMVPVDVSLPLVKLLQWTVDQFSNKTNYSRHISIHLLHRRPQRLPLKQR